MKLTNEQLKKIYYGAYSFKDVEDGYLQAFQYTQAQMDYFKGAFDFWYDRCMATTAKTIEIETDATEISFDYKIIWKGSEDSFELSENDLITKIYYVKDLKEEGNLKFSLSDGKKKAVIYLPSDATVLIKNFEINGEYKPCKKGCKVLWLGDSITQGFGPLRSSQTYVSVANRLLNYDIINQGIGGYVYDKKSLMKMDGYKPEKIIVALGTNQYGSPTMQDVEEYYPRLFEIYGNKIPTLCISPIWRGDKPEEYAIFEKFCENIKKIVKQYKNIKLVEGDKLLPHLSEYYLDNLHPNCLGTEVYGRNLVEKIKELKF